MIPTVNVICQLPTYLSGRRVSNSQPIAWKAIALPIELLPLIYNITLIIIIKVRGQEWIRTTEVERQRIYSPPHLAALEPALIFFKDPITNNQRYCLNLFQTGRWLSDISIKPLEPENGIEPTTC